MDGELQFGVFPPTRWSMVDRAGNPECETGRGALAELLKLYRPALHRYLVCCLRIQSDDAEDLLQAFIADKILQGRLVVKADKSRGRFRNLLMKSLHRYALSKYFGRRKSIGWDEQAADAEPADAGPADAFELAWARQVLHEALRRMQAECQASDRPDIWEIFRCRIADPILNQAAPLAYEKLIEKFNLQSPTQAYNLQVTAKRMFVRSLRSVIGEYEADEEAIDMEIEELKAVFSRSHA